MNPIITAVELGYRRRRRDRMIGIAIVATMFILGLFIAIPLWIHWAEVILEFWGLKHARIVFTLVGAISKNFPIW